MKANEIKVLKQQAAIVGILMEMFRLSQAPAVNVVLHLNHVGISFVSMEATLPPEGEPEIKPGASAYIG